MLRHAVVMLDRRETKEDDQPPALRRSPRFERLLMRVPSLGVAPTLPLFTCVLRAQSTNASLTGRVTDLSKATVAEAKVAAMIWFYRPTVW